LSRRERLRTKYDFKRVFERGRRRGTAHFVVRWRRNEEGIARIGTIAGKKVGGAVRRNRVKRVAREFFRRNKTALTPSADYVIVARKGAHALTYAQVEEELRFLVEARR
jgi:ribonuclease P protein component